MIFSDSDLEAQPWGGPKADENGGAGAKSSLPLAVGLVPGVKHSAFRPRPNSL